MSDWVGVGEWTHKANKPFLENIGVIRIRKPVLVPQRGNNSVTVNIT